MIVHRKSGPVYLCCWISCGQALVSATPRDSCIFVTLVTKMSPAMESQPDNPIPFAPFSDGLWHENLF